MFEAMGLWDDLIAAATPIRRIHVSDRGRFGFSHIDAAQQGVDALGYVVINRVLGEVHGTYVGPGHWFEQDRRHMRIGYAWPLPEELEDGLAAISGSIRAALTI